MRKLVLCLILVAWAACDGRALGIPNETAGGGDTNPNGSSSANGSSGDGSKGSTGPGRPTPAPTDDTCMALQEKAAAWIAAHQACMPSMGHRATCTVLFLNGGFGPGGVNPPTTLEEPVWGCDPVAFGNGDMQELLSINELWSSKGCAKQQCQVQNVPHLGYHCINGMCQK
jgi:hypothetical protein